MKTCPHRREEEAISGLHIFNGKHDRTRGWLSGRCVGGWCADGRGTRWETWTSAQLDSGPKRSTIHTCSQRLKRKRRRTVIILRLDRQNDRATVGQIRWERQPIRSVHNEILTRERRIRIRPRETTEIIRSTRIDEATSRNRLTLNHSPTLIHPSLRKSRKIKTSNRAILSDLDEPNTRIIIIGVISSRWRRNDELTSSTGEIITQRCRVSMSQLSNTINNRPTQRLRSSRRRIITNSRLDRQHKVRRIIKIRL